MKAAEREEADRKFEAAWTMFVQLGFVPNKSQASPAVIECMRTTAKWFHQSGLKIRELQMRRAAKKSPTRTAQRPI